MSASTEKATRREIRRAFGPQAIDAISETRQNAQATVQSVAFAHERLDGLTEQQHAARVELDTAIKACQDRLKALETRSRWQRLHSLVTGR